MKDPTAIIQRCTAQRPNGAFCDMPTAPDMPFPICKNHALRVHERVEGNRQAKITAFRAASTTDPAELADVAERVKAAQRAQAVVYYVRLGDHVKIGTTVNLRQRLASFMADEGALLATEPGGYELEHQRHLQFADERQGTRELFNPSRRLLAHIDAVLTEHGEPVVTTGVPIHV